MIFIRKLGIGGSLGIYGNSLSLYMKKWAEIRYIYKRKIHKPLIQKHMMIPEDLGMLDVYIAPSRSCLPSFWKTPNQRIRLAWRWFYHKIIGWFKKKMFEERIRPVKIDFKQLQSTVGTYYEKVNQAYANGDIKEIDNLCGKAYANTLKSQIAKRPKELQLKWVLHRIIKPPKAVSFSQAQVEIGSNKYLAQIVYKIHSEQTLTIFLNGLKKEESLKELVEYYVFQYKTWVLPYKWYIWGKTVEASPDAVKVKLWKKDGKSLRTVGF
ncbi:hypothetical protein T552_04187 [Pneumocystis carinii B80]|uniref:Tim44-like domain-containing protein n=1 Tax=Pneumocystis carinii (strain B80) TaxID=1408658 RepID=A0A0W4ZD87_PNEC8|nr:hypothetical protein T552_04187 [Pneumocystis carinii B80]KTW26360.1 hypothetical protein T552_04187 [Pneumocystis carinii B80]